MHWEELLRLVLSSKAELENTRPAGEVDSGLSRDLGEWLAAVRVGGAGLQVTDVAQPSFSNQQRLAKLMEAIGVPGIDPAHILVAAEAGSHLYNLTLPTSDTDYIIIYRHSTQALVSSVSHLKVKVQ